MRKHYLDGQSRGTQVRIAAEAQDYAARTPGARVEMVGEEAVLVMGDPPPGAVAAFVAHRRRLRGAERAAA